MLIVLEKHKAYRYELYFVLTHHGRRADGSCMDALAKLLLKKKSAIKICHHNIHE